MCDLCTDTNKAKVKTKDSSTTNLFSHLRYHHPAKHAEIAPVPMARSTPKHKSKRPYNQPTIMQTVKLNTPYTTDSDRHKLLVRSVTRYLVSGMVPLYTADKEEFRNMVTTLDPRFQCPHRNHFTRSAIPSLYTDMRNQVGRDIQEAHWVSLTSDGWLSVARDSYMSLTAHYIDPDWNLVARCLKTQYHPESHTAVNLAVFFREALDEYGLKPGYVVSMTTDSAANMVAAAREAGMRRVPCLGHMLHNAVSKSLETDEIKQLLAHCRKMVALFHNSQPYRTKLKKVMKDLQIPEKQLINDVVTRWGSKFKMLQRVKELMKATNQVLMDDKKYRDLSVSWQQAALIDVILKCLEGFNTLTDSLSGEKEVTISSAIPLLRHINALCKVEEEEDPTSVTIKSTIKSYLAEKIAVHDLLTFLRVAEVLDPRYQELSSDDDCSPTWLALPTIEEVKDYIFTNAPAVINCRPTPTCSGDDGKVLCLQPEKKTKTSLVDLLMSHTQSNAEERIQQDQSPEVEVEEKLKREVEFFLRLKAGKDENVLKWWKSHMVELPVLAQYARYVLSACASSVPSERLFSISGNIISKKRNALKPQLVDQLVFLAMNKDMIK